MKRPRVKDVLHNYQLGGIKQVENYLGQPDLIIDPSTWVGNIQKLLKNANTISVSAEIELIINEFNFNKYVL